MAFFHEAQNMNELAFAMGALAPLRRATTTAIRLAVNASVPNGLPEMRSGENIGKEVTYEDDPAAHLKTEFGFDVVEVAKGQYAPQAYHDFIGFEVAKEQLERAFRDTYSIDLKDVMRNEDLALGTFRFTVSNLIPEATKAAWAAKKKDIMAAQPGITREKFLYHLSHSSYRKNWGEKYEKPGIFARFIAFVFRIVPKVGPFRALSFKAPSPQAETLFMASFDQSLAEFQRLVPEVAKPGDKLTDMNLDTGAEPRPGSYKLADKAYVELLEKLADKHAAPSPELKRDILAYVPGLSIPLTPKAQEGLALVKATEPQAAGERTQN